MKGVRVTKTVKEMRSAVAWGELEAKKLFSERIIHKIFETSPSFHVKYEKNLIDFDKNTGHQAIIL